MCCSHQPPACPWHSYSSEDVIEHQVILSATSLIRVLCSCQLVVQLSPPPFTQLATLRRDESGHCLMSPTHYLYIPMNGSMPRRLPRVSCQVGAVIGWSNQRWACCSCIGVRWHALHLRSRLPRSEAVGRRAGCRETGTVPKQPCTKPTETRGWRLVATCIRTCLGVLDPGDMIGSNSRTRRPQVVESKVLVQPEMLCCWVQLQGLSPALACGTSVGTNK